MENDFEEQESDQIKTSTYSILKQISKYIEPHIGAFALGLLFYIVFAN